MSYIGGHAFANCDGLTEIEIPGSIQYLNDSQFWGCKNLEKVKVNEGVKGLAAFVYCSSLKSVELPDSLEYLDATAFDSCSQLTSIRIPDSVTQIGYGAFKNCDSLLQITLPKVLKSVMENAFSGCAGLKTVYYAGKEDDWNQISIASGNEPLLNAVKRWESSGPQNVVSVPFQDHTYALIDDTLPWQEAKAVCEEMGGYLVTINSPAEQEFLTELVQFGTKKNVWIGGDETGTGKFCWSTGEAMNYANWELGQPGSKGEERRGMMMYTPLGAGLASTWRAVSKTGISNSGYALSDFGYICEWGDYSTEKEEREFDPDQEVVRQVSLYTSDGGKSFRREQQLMDDLYASGKLTMEQWWKLKYQFWADYGVTDLRESLAYMRDASAAEQAYDYLTDDELFLAYQYMYYLNCTTKGQVARGLLWSQDFIYNGNTPSQVLDISNFINQETVSIKGYKTMLLDFMKYQTADMSMYEHLKGAKTALEAVVSELDKRTAEEFKEAAKHATTPEEIMELFDRAFDELVVVDNKRFVKLRRTDLTEISDGLEFFGDALQFTADSTEDIATLMELELQMELARTYDDFLKEIAEAESSDGLPLGLIIAAKELREELTDPLLTVLFDCAGHLGDHMVDKVFDLHKVFHEKLGDVVGSHLPGWLQFKGELFGDALKTIEIGAGIVNFLTDMGGVVEQSRYVEAYGMLGQYYSGLLAESRNRFLSDKTPEHAWEFYDRYQSLFAIREAGENAYLDMCSKSAFTKIIGEWSGSHIADKKTFVENTFKHMNERCRLILWSEELDTELTGHHVAKKAAVKCPVNVEIYDPSGSLIYTIQDGVESDVTMQQGRFVCRYEPLTGDYTKILYFFDDGDYQLKMIGTDAGEVSMGLASMASGTEMTEWQANGIPVLKGGMIQLNLSDGTYQADGNADGTFEMSGTLDERKTSAALAGLVLSRDELTLQTGQTAALGVSASPAGTMLPHVWWESSNQAVASVSDGAVTALAKGTAVITVHSEDLTAQCVVNVTRQEHSGETTDPAPGPTPDPTPGPTPEPDPIPAHQSKSDDSDDDDTAAAWTGGCS
ncbi:MAG: leucine-rich repeat protein [Clostridium sp.]